MLGKIFDFVQRRTGFKLHTVYFVLAAFDLITIGGGLYLSHRIMLIYEESVEINQTWAQRLADVSQLSELASDVNAPGNDVFDSLAVTEERKRQEAALAAFTAHLDRLQVELPAAAPELAPALADVEVNMNEMVSEAHQIFTYFETGRAKEAGSRMATMDRKYAAVTRSVNEAAGTIQSLQDEQFEGQLGLARDYRGFEYLLGGMILLIVGCVLAYGHRIGAEMRKNEAELHRLMKALEERERVAQTRLHDAIENMTESAAFFDAAGRFVHCNERYAKMFAQGFPAEDLAGKSFEEILRAELARGLYVIDGLDPAEWAADRRAQFESANSEARVQLQDGRWIRIYDRRTAEGGTVVLTFDITDRIEGEKRIEFLAQNDSLTGLPNRQSYFDKLEEALGEERATGVCGTVAVHYVDLDHFKRINDTLGHDAGDAVLQEVARRMTAISDETVFPCRLGGDEFAIVQRAGEEGEVHRLAAALLAVLRQPVVWRDNQLAVHASIGLSMSTQDTDAVALTKNADLALYAAKASGRNAAQFFDEGIGSKHAARLSLEQAVLAASETEGFELHYQPILELSNGRLKGFEALLRLPTESGEYISPVDFIPVAEELGEIVKIGAWVLGEACRTAARWPNELTVSVNISALQFRDGELKATVERALNEAGLAAHRLELEITESLLLDTSADVKEQTQALRALGVRISLDDFGTGYSALNYLWRYPLDKLKIDRSFVAAYSENEEAKGVLSAIIDLGQRLNLPVVAEGVESEAQSLHLKTLGCELAQGFLFGKAIPAAQLPGFILRDFSDQLQPGAAPAESGQSPVLRATVNGS